ncbi:uncharacterized protein [Lepeophtheirus salmonis]|nr:uncharacterized protein LOC121121901 [Lepeophtheirus salmonis]
MNKLQVIILCLTMIGLTSSERRDGRRYIDQRRETRQTGGGSPRDLVSEIHCIQSSNIQSFTAFLRLPESFKSIPVLEAKTPPKASSDVCLITKTNVEEVYALDLGAIEDCGVSSCQEGSEFDWLCVTVRFPLISGLKMPEDEVIDIKCKPQDRSIEGNNVVNFQENAVEQRSPAVFLGGGQEFLSEIGLFRKLPGTDLFASRVKSGSTIELGENIQLRSIVRAGDGWTFAKITDVVVHRVHEGVPLNEPKDIAPLVFPNGCRNPSYSALAPFNPWRDTENGLINNFDFRVFMFQEMESGDAIMITAKIIACVEEIDCSPIRCGEDKEPGYGRKRRSVGNETSGKTQGWEENVQLKIRMPEYNSIGDSPQTTTSFNNIPITESECKIYLIVTLSVALTFCILSAIIVLVACVRRYQEVKSRRKQRALEGEDRRGSSGKVSRSESTNGKATVAYYPYIIDPRNFTGGPLPPPIHASSQNNQKPVTVRSVKRRDKAKFEEKRQIAAVMSSQSVPTTPKLLRNDERAVMV